MPAWKLLVQPHIMKCAGLNKLMVVAGLLTVVGACAADVGEPADDLSEVSALDGKSDTPLSTIKFAGEIELGFGRRVLYTKSPKYRAVKFHAEAGTMLEVYVRSTHGDPVTWLVGPKLDIVGESDDANEETNSNISIESLEETGDYYILFRDKRYESHYFDVAAVQLNLPANAPTVQQIEPVYEGLVANNTLASAEVAGKALPFLAKGLYDRWTADKKAVPGLQVNAYALDVAGQTVWLVRKYLPGAGLEAGAYVESGPMVGIAGGASELIDSWEY